MPNRYEREIEEILRNLEQTDPKPGLGQKFNGRLRRNASPRMPVRSRTSFSFRFSLAEWLLIVAIVAALIAGGYAYLTGPGLFSAVLATVGIVCIILVAFSPFLFHPRQARSTRYGNVTITPLHRNPLTNVKTRWQLFLLKLRYRGRRED
jgi:hypothetical protein